MLDFFARAENGPSDESKPIELDPKEPLYAKYWHNVKLAATLKTIDGKSGARATAEKAVENLQALHIGMDHVTAKMQVTSDMALIPGRRNKISMFYELRNVMPLGDKPAQLKALRAEIEELEARIALEKANPPHLADGEEPFRAWRDRIPEKYNTVGRRIGRAMWRRNRKIEAAIGKGAETRKMVEANWKADVVELERTLNTFKSHLARLKPKSGGSENMGQLDEEKKRLDEVHKKLMEQLTEQQQEREAANLARHVEKRTQKREAEAEAVKKDEQRLEGDHAKVGRGDLLRANLGTQSEPATLKGLKRLAIQNPGPSKQGFLGRDSENVISDSNGERLQENKAMGAEDSDIRDMDDIIRLRERRDALKKALLEAKGKGGNVSAESRSLLDNRPGEEEAPSQASSNSNVDPEIERLIARRDALRKAKDEILRKHDAALEQPEAANNPSSKAPSTHRLKDRISLDRNGNIWTASLEAQADALPPADEEVKIEQKELTTEARLQQLRDISQSISFLKKFAATTQPDGPSSSTARKVEGLLQELEDEVLGVAEDGLETEEEIDAEVAANSATTPEGSVPIRWSNRNPNGTTPEKSVPIRWSNQNPNDTHKSRQEKELEAASSIFGESNQPEPIRAWPNPQPETTPRSLAEQLKAQFSSPGKVKIDDDLTVDLDVEVPSLQSQILQLSQKLKREYPLMDTLPYDVWTSEKRQMLQTWLKILAWKWQTRNDKVVEGMADSAQPTEDVSLDVRGLLEQMVLEHDLSKKAAARMVKRWAQVFERQEERKLGVEHEYIKVDPAVEELDWDEIDAGMGFLRDEGENVGQETVQVKRKETPKPTHDIPADLPFSWTGKQGQGYRSGATSVSAAVGAQGYHTAASRRGYSTSTRLLNKPAGTSSTAMDTDPQTVASLLQGSAKSRTRQESHPEDPFANGELADFLAAVSKNPQAPVPVGNNPTPLKVSPAASSEAATNPSAVPDARTQHEDQKSTPAPQPQPSLPHLTPSGAAHMVSVSAKPPTLRTAIATGSVHFSNPTPLSLIASAQNKKGDVLSVSRIAGIMAAKHTPTLIPLCHPIMLTHVGVELYVFGAGEAEGVGKGEGGIVVESKVQCEGQTGVEMEALTSVVGAALSVVDMCKAVDKGMRIEGVRVVVKEGGRSGVWREEGWRSRGE